jgi:uncharacterized protein
MSSCSVSPPSTSSPSAPSDGGAAVPSVSFTDAAAALVADLRSRHGDVFFVLSHGCCDGTTPLCLAPGDLTMGADDRQIGTVAGAAVFAGREQCSYLAHLDLQVDVAAGSNGGFSLEDGSGQRFLVRPRPRG